MRKEVFSFKVTHKGIINDSIARYSKEDIELALKADGINLEDLTAPLKYFDQKFGMWSDLPEELQVPFKLAPNS